MLLTGRNAIMREDDVQTGGNEVRADIYGIVLAGGRSRRMKGPDKVFSTLGDRPLIDHVFQRLAPQCRGMVLNRNGDPARLAAFACPVVPDDMAGSAGPLAGLVASLDWIAAHHPAVVFAVSSAADMPFLPHDLADRLHRAARRGGHAVACAASAGRRHPVAALWPLASRDELRQALAKGERRVSAVLDGMGCVDVEWPSDPFDPFFNINTPADLDHARQIIGTSTTS